MVLVTRLPEKSKRVTYCIAIRSTERDLYIVSFIPTFLIKFRIFSYSLYILYSSLLLVLKSTLVAENLLHQHYFKRESISTYASLHTRAISTAGLPAVLMAVPWAQKESIQAEPLSLGLSLRLPLASFFVTVAGKRPCGRILSDPLSHIAPLTVRTYVFSSKVLGSSSLGASSSFVSSSSFCTRKLSQPIFNTSNLFGGVTCFSSSSSFLSSFLSPFLSSLSLSFLSFSDFSSFLRCFSSYSFFSFSFSASNSRSLFALAASSSTFGVQK